MCMNRVRKGKHHIVNGSFPSGGEDKGDYLSSIYQLFFFFFFSCKEKKLEEKNRKQLKKREV